MKKKLKEFTKNKTLVGVICIGFAIGLTIINTSIKGNSGGIQTKALITTGEISAGDKITESMVEEIRLQGDIPDNIITSKDEVIGKYANTDIYGNDIITTDKLNVEAIYGSAYLENLEEDERAISISLKTLAIGLSGKLESGDIVSIISIDEDGNSTILEELKYVELISVSDNNGYDVGGTNNTSDKNVGSTTTLLVNEEQAKLLASLEVKGQIHVSLVYRGNDEHKQQLLEKQKSMFSETNQEDNQQDISEQLKQENVIQQPEQQKAE